METLKSMEIIGKVLDYLKEDDERTLQELLEMCQIPAPSHMEQKKAEYVRVKMEQIGLDDVHTDAVGNVLGTIRGSLQNDIHPA